MGEVTPAPIEAFLDTSAMPVLGMRSEEAKDGSGRLYADIGWSNSLGWYEGFCLLVALNPVGALTGFGFASASTKDQPLAESFFALRARPNPRLRSVGSAALGPYVLDKGFEGEDNHRRWLDRYGARLICPPKRTERKRRRWPKRLLGVGGSEHPPDRRDRVYEKLHNSFSVFAGRDLTTYQRVASAVGGEGGAAQLLYLVQ